MKKNILVIPGDGIGPEVTHWGKAVLEQIATVFDHEFIFDEALMGHAAIEATGNPLPDETLEKARKSDAILFGAVGHAKYDNDPSLKVRPEQGLLKIRKELGLYANLRPILLFDELLNASSIKAHILRGTDILFFRELTGDVYFGEKTRSEDKNTASDLMIYHKYEVERIAHKAYEAAMQRGRKLCSVDKANVLESSRLWRETVQEIAKQYPEVETQHLFVDNAAMQLIKDPKQFDVVLTANLFGDILTDEASQIAGSMGMLASASVGDGTGFFEPIHGSAHDITGKDLANPLASILSAALMLEISFGLKEEAQLIISTVDKVLKEGYRTSDIADDSTSPYKVLGTKDMGKLVLKFITQQTYTN
ncbi:3-isopropylmalate dehydrogenase [Pedobacter cryoconitis]|uniref:3-isopropylmalate dehydrogenase n=1 Tax=Pedobacter cryoconitis TaxID=188932 RepID=A0A7W8ZR04_9SPHI|nr:3-isopropylmalate dehydrogenase [Pedobacter cryoconitis]MBB5638609.1 3-isopropylmalate dehydrogenase [Pedobacter cryoconitis]MBB6274340.1 3-isopropylmalate dehydrogenase [Pedobacter cryoconitis]